MNNLLLLEDDIGLIDGLQYSLNENANPPAMLGRIE